MSKFNHKAAKNQFVKFLEKEGISFDVKHAQTGSIYIELDQFTIIRFANHQDAYGTSVYTVDGIEGTYKGLMAWFKASDWYKEEKARIETDKAEYAAYCASFEK